MRYEIEWGNGNLTSGDFTVSEYPSIHPSIFLFFFKLTEIIRGKWPGGSPLWWKLAFLFLFYSFCDQNPDVYWLAIMLVPTSSCMFAENHKTNLDRIVVWRENKCPFQNRMLSHKWTILASSISLSKIQKTQTSYLLQWPSSELNVWMQLSWMLILIF